MYIIGAGMAGLLAGVMNQTATILEASDKLPDFHKAVFRLRTDAISHFTGIKMKEVVVNKAVWFKGQERQITPRLANYYSMKVIDCIQQRSILNIDPIKRYIPPANFVELLADKCRSRIKFGAKVVKINSEFIEIDRQPIILDRRDHAVISTMPMPILRNLLHPNARKIDFNTYPVIVSQFKVYKCDSYATIYYPDPKMGVYRATLDGNKLIIEGTRKITDNELSEVRESFGIQNIDPIFLNKEHKASKISPIDSQYRQSFIYKTTINHNIYSLGRYATWRPSVVLDDVFDDIFVITNLIQQNNYEKAKYLQEEL
jgi:hypothetical protein